jgi:aminoglycoside phosphotransferase family enzyme/predicted kinase
LKAGSVKETHLSRVFLTRDFAFKVKKPVRFPFADYSTRARRLHFCQLELELNRRLAPEVYVDVVFLEDGEPAVKMRRLRESDNFLSRLKAGTLEPTHLKALARRLVRFFREARPAAPALASFTAVSGHWKRNLSESRPFLGKTLSPQVHRRLKALSASWLLRLKTLITRRSSLCKDGHGDLRLEHIYLPNFEVLDCVEFNASFRCGDPLMDLAFTVMDLEFNGRADLAQVFRAALEKETHWKEPRLLDFYVAYRHLVRGKVDSIQGKEDRAQAHFLAALAKLEKPADQPRLVLVGGLPGSGKSYFSKQMARKENFVRVSSDETRKQLAGVDLQQRLPQACYSPEWSNMTYDQCLRLAEKGLLEGKKVVVDATFAGLKRRKDFLALARRLHVPFRFLICQADEATILKRLSQDQRHASDAGWEVYEKIKKYWQANDGEIEKWTQAVTAS